jgi:hypothetical protein
MRGLNLWRAIPVGLVIASAAAEVQAQQILYRYDAQGRLIRVARPQFADRGYITTYTYDDADNRAQKYVTFGPTANLLLRPLGMPQIELASTRPSRATDPRYANATPVAGPTAP